MESSKPKPFNSICKAYLEDTYRELSGFVGYEAGEKEENQKNNIFLTYGEILYDSVDKILNELNLDENDVFYDLGSGVGKMVTQVFMNNLIKKCVGIEASVPRYQNAMKALECIRKDFPILFKNDRIINFECQNFLSADLQDATIVYSCSTCFSEDLLDKIAKKVNECPKIKYLMSLKKINCKLPLLKTVEIECTWDKSICNIYGIS
ncbi:MAG: hypothetical protein JWM09_757 [Francisellaceae bacterium]|nr:hypothetical protein [Francisellaceae bacterium]